MCLCAKTAKEFQLVRDKKSDRRLGEDSRLQIRKEQLDVVTSFIEGNDVFVSLPTGGGKSLCLACLPLVFDNLRGVSNKSIAIIVSPLNALMQDQVTKFTSRGISAVCVGSECCSTLADKVTSGEVQLIYMSPETILTVPTWREMFRNQQYHENLICLAVDEAHLIEKWFVVCVCVACMWYVCSAWVGGRYKTRNGTEPEVIQKIYTHTYMCTLYCSDSRLRLMENYKTDV